MAMHLGRKFIRQISSRRFVAGTGGDLGASTGLAGARQGARSYHSSNNHGYYSFESARQLILALPKVPGGAMALIGLWCYQKKEESILNAMGAKAEEMRKKAEGEVGVARKEFDAKLIKSFQEEGLSRELREIMIAELEQQIESGSGSEADKRSNLYLYEELLRLSTSGLS